MTRVLICNGVLVNGGDAGLVITLKDKFEAQGEYVCIATHSYNFVKNNYTGNFCKDIVGYHFAGYRNLFSLFAIPFAFLKSKEYRECDIIIGAPGGYINSYYGFFWKVYVLFFAKMVGKKTAIYSQSIGPLKSRHKYILKIMSRFIDIIVVRDKLSYNTIINVGVDQKRILLSNDAIFLRKPEVKLKTTQTKEVAISVRAWSEDCRDIEKYQLLIAKISDYLIGLNYKITFLSTCQGIDGYIDDSEMADKILTKITDDCRNLISIDNKYRNYESLMSELTKFDFVISTRLHMCLFSMLKGIPAFNISYESKGIECYSSLGLTNLSIDYNEDYDVAIKKIDNFVNSQDQLAAVLPEIINAEHGKANFYFNKLCERIS